MEKVDQQIRAPLKSDGKNLSYESGRHRLIIAQLVLRVGIVVATAIIVAILGVTLHSPDSLAYGLYMGGNIVACILAFLPLVSFVPYLLCGKQIKSNHIFCLYVHDLISIVLLLCYDVAAYMIEFVGLDGQQATLTTDELCDQAPNSCFNVAVSMAFSCVTMAFFILLITVSRFMLKHKL